MKKTQLSPTVSTEPAGAAAAAAAPHAALVYVGPPGQTSPVFGKLEPGQRYTTADATFAAYLAKQHPDYWQSDTAKE